MLDAPPRETARMSWLYVAVGVVIVYGTIPLARTLLEVVDENIGREVLLYLTALLVLIAALVAWRNLRKRELPLAAYLWLVAILIVSGVFIYRLRAIPEEAIHVAEYGVLGLLVYRALTHRIRDYSIYFAAALIVGIVGVLDEFIQWVVPARYFDLRDIATNFVAGCLAQIAICAGLRPRLIRSRPTARSYARLCRIVAMGLVLLAIGFQNTPARVAWYAAPHPALSFLLDNQSTMAEYGYRHHGTATGAFYSRFTVAELAQLDRERGGEVAQILDRYIRGDGYRAFLARHSVIRDPYAHEAGVHLFRREYHIDRAREGTAQQAEHYQIGYYENEILQRHFNRAIELSSHHWDQAILEEVDAGAAKTPDYESTVSAGMITRMTVTQVLLVFIAAIALLLLLGWRFSRLRPGEGPE